MADPSMTSSHRVVTADDQSALLLIIALFLMVTFIFSVIGRISISYGMTKTLNINDVVAIVSMLLGVGQTAAVSFATDHGLGRQQSALTTSRVTTIVKALYASDYFYITALACSKISLLLLLRKLAVQKIHKTIFFYTNCYVGVWAVASVIALGARCGTSVPWGTTQPGECANDRNIWIGICPFDLLSELVIVVSPIFMMAPVHVPTSRKVFVCAAFGSRILYGAAVIVRLFFLPQGFTVSNFTFTDKNAVLVTQIVLCLAITTSCIPAMKPLMEAFNSGGMVVRVHHGGNGYYGSGSRSGTGHDRKRGSGIKDSSMIGATELQSGLSSRRKQSSSDEPTMNDERTHTMSNDSGGRDSISSLARSEQMIIKKDVQWTVHYDDNELQQRTFSDLC